MGRIWLRVSDALSRAARRLRFDAPGAPILWASVVLVPLLAITLTLYHVERADHLRDVSEDTQLMAGTAGRQVRKLVMDDIRPLRRLARELESGTLYNPSKFIDSARSIQNGVRSLRAIGWVDPGGRIQATSFAEGEVGTSAGDASAELHAQWKQISSRLRWLRRTDVQIHADQASQWLVVPFALRGAGGSLGVVVGRAQLFSETTDLLDETSRQWFALEIRDERDQVVFASGQPADVAVGARLPVDIVGHAWTVHLRPTAAFVAARQRRLPDWILWGGVAISLLTSAMVFQWIQYRRRGEFKNRQHLAALEAINEISKAIAGQPGEPQQALEQLGTVTARVAGMSMLTVALYDAPQRRLRVVFAQGMDPPLDRIDYGIDEAPVSKRCMQTNEVVAVPDVESGGPFEPQRMARYGIRSVLLLPLVVSEAPIGVIMLADSKPRQFAEADVRLAKLIASEASVMLLNIRMHRETDEALQSLRRVLQQRETLFAVNTLIQHAGSPQQALDRIAELAPRALDVDVCVVLLRADEIADSDSIRIAAVTHAQPPFPVPVNTQGRCAHSADVFRTRQPLVIPDAANDPEYSRLGITGIGSAMYVPLTGEARDVQGILALMRRSAGGFDTEQIKLAQVFAARAAAAIHAAKLYEQSRRQAETNATLLRELNHRVKNNLAGIVGLLSAGAPKLPHDARQWLYRAVDRIHTMARAHDLFSGGLHGVALEDLVRTTLATAIGISAGDVTVDAELDGVADVTLSTDQAVTLAMVLHELAYNAVEHALHEGGRLLIKGRRDPTVLGCAGTDGAIMIDVIDEPATLQASRRNWMNEPASLDHRGMGLDLVRGLVGRELRGAFSLTARPAGGTVATVSFCPQAIALSTRSGNGVAKKNGNGNGVHHHGERHDRT